MYNNIPQELRDLNQWILWKYELVDGRQTKVPYSTKGYKASIQNPATWSSFAEVMQAGPSIQASGIGLVLTANDPYSGIDIDNKPENPASPAEQLVHQKILEAFPSYTERSVGGHGYHIIVRGKVPRGSDRGHVGIYSIDRYLTFTGQVVRDAPILDCQATLDILYREMQPVKTVELQDADELLDDREIVDMAMGASNADKFNELCIGDWQSMGYGSQSEADFALLGILAFYTRNNEQVRRIFRMSKLGKREKAIRDNKYLDFALTKIRAQQPAPIDFSQLQANATAMREQPAQQQQAQHQVDTETGEIHQAEEQSKFPITLPPGLVGELAQYFYRTSTRPVPEVSLLAAIGAVAGVCGRSYNINQRNRSGLNLYALLIAGSGTGKEALNTCITDLYQEVHTVLPMANVNQFIGPSIFASGPALHRILSERPCFVSVLGEFGLTVQRLSSQRANSADLTLKQVLLDSFGKSGHGKLMQPSVYSDREKNIAPVASPSMTIMAETTPSTFFDGLDQSDIASGFLSRFIILEYTGGRPPINDQPYLPLPAGLKQRFSDLVSASSAIAAKQTVSMVTEDAQGEAVLRAFDKEVDKHMNSADQALSEIWNRTHLKAWKLAGIIAVGCNPHNPVITEAIATWAVQLVEHDARSLEKRFTVGDVGQGDGKQMSDLQRIISNYFKSLPPAAMKVYGAMQKDGVVPHAYLLQRTACVASFKNDKLGATNALKKTIQAMTDSGMLVLIPEQTVSKNYRSTQKMYGIVGNWK